MKRVLLAVAAALVGAGCATLTPVESDVDEAYVAAVERAAQRYGTQVIWINYPRKAAAAN
jgi:ornithine carbamoyltransferase